MIGAGALIIFGGLAGAVAGSFCTTAALRSLRAEQFMVGGSRCDGCGAPVPMGYSLPILSFVALSGGGRCCGARIDHAHPVGEAAGLLIGAGALLVADWIRSPLLLVLGFALLAASVIDARTQRLPNLLIALTAICGLALAADRSPQALGLAVVAGGAAFVALELVRRGFQLVRRRPGIGFGDVKLIAALAIWFGPAVAWALVLASLAGLIGFAVLKPANGRLAFGPFIAAAGWLVGIGMELAWWPTLFS